MLFTDRLAWSTSLVDLSRLTVAEKVVVGSAGVLLVASLLPWFTVDFAEFGEATLSGWDVPVPFGRLPVLLGLVMAAHVLLTRFAPDLALPDLPWPTVHLGAGVTAAVLVLTKLVAGQDDGVPLLDAPVTKGFGLLLAALAASVLAIGGVLYRRQEP